MLVILVTREVETGRIGQWLEPSPDKKLARLCFTEQVECGGICPVILPTQEV
jgi:hypothetical protein